MRFAFYKLNRKWQGGLLGRDVRTGWPRSKPLQNNH